MNRNIQMVDLKSQYERIKPEVDAAMQEVLNTTAFINGPAVKDFGNSLAEFLNVKHVIPCANGTDALQIAMMAFDFPKDSEILVPSWTYVATVEVIALLGFKPVFVEVDPNTFNIDINDLKSKKSDNSVAIVPVHLYGQCANMEEILSFAEQSNLVVMEDTAQALGSEYTFSSGKIAKAGTMGDVGTTSFFPSKNLGCFGDGGAMMTNDDELAVRLRMIANHGQKKKYINSSIGVNSRLDTLQAAVLNVKLRYLDEYASARQQVAKRYDEAFKDVEGVNTPAISSYSTHVYHQYTLKLDDQIDRDELKTKLEEKGIPSMVYYPIPNHLQEAYSFYSLNK